MGGLVTSESCYTTLVPQSRLLWLLPYKVCIFTYMHVHMCKYLSGLFLAARRSMTLPVFLVVGANVIEPFLQGKMM